MGTGGLSHQLDGDRAGFVNKNYDRFCLDNIGPAPDALTRNSALDIVELAGSQGVDEGPTGGEVADAGPDPAPGSVGPGAGASPRA